MQAIIAYILGILTVLVIIIPFYLLARNNSSISRTYSNVLCSDLAS